MAEANFSTIFSSGIAVKTGEMIVPKAMMQPKILMLICVGTALLFSLANNTYQSFSEILSQVVMFSLGMGAGSSLIVWVTETQKNL